jgi:Cd2+/Zn2+-exporting ATPase
MRTDTARGAYSGCRTKTPDFHEAQQFDMEMCVGCNPITAPKNGPYTRIQSEEETNEEEEVTSFFVKGICCPAEIPVIENIVSRLDESCKTSVNVVTKRVTVHHHTSLDPRLLIRDLNAACLGASLIKSTSSAYKGAAARAQLNVHEDQSLPSDAFYEALPPWNICFSCLFFLVASLSLFSEKNSFYESFRYFAVLSCILAWPVVAMKALSSLRVGILDINCLMSLAAVGAIAIEKYLEGASVLIIFSLSEWLETRVTQNIRDALSSLLLLAPDTAEVLLPEDRRQSGAETLQMAVEDVPLESTVIIRPGEKIPLDGVVKAGESRVNQALLTGEASPVRKVCAKGSNLSKLLEQGQANLKCTDKNRVFAGTINLDGYLEVITTATAEDSAWGRLHLVLEQAHSSKSPTEQIVKRFTDIYTLVVVLSATVLVLASFCLKAVGLTDMQTAVDLLYVALQLIVIACPCGIVISTPMAYTCCLIKAARNNIFIKGGKFLESFGRLDSILFDKTGTLTKGTFELSEWHPIGPVTIPNSTHSFSNGDILRIVASVEAQSQHPIAKAFTDRCRNTQLQLLSAHDFKIIPGIGVSAVVDLSSLTGDDATSSGDRTPSDSNSSKLTVHIVNVTRANSEYGNLISAEDKKRAKMWNGSGGTTGCVFVSNADLAQGSNCSPPHNPRTFLALFSLNDIPRPEAASVIAYLQKRNIRTVMLTGDNCGSAEGIKCQLGMDESHAEMLPEDKYQMLIQKKKAGREEPQGHVISRWCPCECLSFNGIDKGNTLAMVGDGVNDAPCLAASDIGIAMGFCGTSLACDSADVIIADDNLGRIPFLHALSESCLSTIRANILFCVVLKMFILFALLVGRSSLWLAVIADVGALTVVSFNSMRLLLDQGTSPPTSENISSSSEV